MPKIKINHENAQRELEIAEQSALDMCARWHRCRLEKRWHGVPAGTPCDACIEDAKYIAQEVVAKYNIRKK